MSSPRYIDAHKIKLLNSLGGKDENGDLLISLRDVQNAIAQTPTEDVVPIRKGKWIFPNTCSECGRIHREFWEPKFCPVCGSKMESESEANDDL